MKTATATARRIRGGVVVRLSLLGILCAPAVHAVPFPFNLFVKDHEATAHLHVLMINGGGKRAQNYQSHLLHVEQLLQVLLKAGVRRTNISVFSSDGADPEADLAVRQPQLEPDFWLLRGTNLEPYLGARITFTNSTVPGVHAEAATKERLRAWFEGAARRLRPGDTLLVYVTDHGTKNDEDIANNRIVLWGENASLSVNELKELIGLFDPNVTVVSLMSQCFSGAFANLSYLGTTDGVPRGNICGFYSSTADRPAYGCYPENRGRENVGHSFEFIQALSTSTRFPEAHAQVLVTDRTPDVPLKSSDVYLEEALQRAVRARGEEFPAGVDALLEEAWHNKAAWEPEIRLLDRIGHAFGYFSPRSLAELEDQAKLLPDISDKLRTYASKWKAALTDLTRENLQRFLDAQPSWRRRLDPAELRQLDAAGARRLTAALLADLVPFTRGDAATDARLRSLKEKADRAAAASYRMQVRLGVVLRMRAVLTDVAGRVYMETQADPTERAAYQALRGCEDLTLGTKANPAAAQVAEPEPFPSYDEELKLAESVLPAWMGIQFNQPKPEVRKQKDLGEGAAAVMAVYPDSPAQKAGFAVGDIILGPPDAPFTERNQIREWTMLSTVNEPAPLDVLRGARRLRLALVPQPFPLSWPALPSPPKIGSPAPPLDLKAYRGKLPADLDDGRPHLLFFWATWCAPCKASLPEVLAFERARGAQVIAITDELGEQLDTFFKGYDGPFPQTVAVDAYRHAFMAYGVSGTPSFVLVDGDGVVRATASGYSLDKGIKIEGWTWAGRPSTPVPGG
jgi:thiol-disulfide isomerase/thioredoxin